MFTRGKQQIKAIHSNHMRLNLSPCINLQVTDDSGKIFQLPVPVA